MSDAYLLAGANFALCIGIAFIAFCRLNNMHGNVLNRVVSEYAVYMGGALVAAFAPWYGEWPGFGSLAIAAALFIGLACSGYVWRWGVPFSATKQHLDEDEEAT